MTRPRRATEDCIDVAARYLASDPPAVTRALDTHSPREDGRCRGCGHGGVRWPCAVAAIARRAFALLGEP
jgi:hypothetical protein